MPHFPATFSQLDTGTFPLIQRLYYIVLYVLLADALCPLVGFWRASPFFCRKHWSRRRQNSGGSVPVKGSGSRVLTSAQDTVMVESFSEVGMVTQVSTIQAVTETTDRPPCDIESLPMHPRDLLDQTWRDLDDIQQHQLAGVLLRYADLFPIPGSTLTGHTDAVEQEIDTGDGSPIRCCTRRMSPHKIKKEEEVCC